MHPGRACRAAHSFRHPLRVTLVAGDFGPYGAPFSFDIDFAEWSQFDQQIAFQFAGATPPEDGNGNPIWFMPGGVKAAGVTMQLTDGLGATSQLTPGVYAVGVNRLRIYDSTGQPLHPAYTLDLTGAAQPQANDVWRLSVDVSATLLSVSLSTAFLASMLPETPAVLRGMWPKWTAPPCATRA